MRFLYWMTGVAVAAALACVAAIVAAVASGNHSPLVALVALAVMFGPPFAIAMLRRNA